MTKNWCMNCDKEVRDSELDDECLCPVCNEPVEMEVVCCDACGQPSDEHMTEHNDEMYCSDCYDFHITCRGDYHRYYGVSPSDFI